jgi:hypothetical protein
VERPKQSWPKNVNISDRVFYLPRMIEGVKRLNVIDLQVKFVFFGQVMNFNRLKINVYDIPRRGRYYSKKAASKI